MLRKLKGEIKDAGTVSARDKLSVSETKSCFRTMAFVDGRGRDPSATKVT